MKKTLFLFASLLFFGVSATYAQDVYEFTSFNFYKGTVSVDHNRYDSFTFALQLKDNAEVEVSSVLVNGVEADSHVFKCGSLELYTVKVPKKAHTKVGKQFEVAINFADGVLLMGSDLVTEGDVNTDGGPGTGGDPTVIIIKYP